MDAQRVWSDGLGNDAGPFLVQADACRPAEDPSRAADPKDARALLLRRLALKRAGASSQ